MPAFGMSSACSVHLTPRVNPLFPLFDVVVVLIVTLTLRVPIRIGVA
jgi:hypothetical protein